MPKGCAPTVSVAVTAAAAVSMTDTVPSIKLVTYTRVPSGVVATPNGSWPTGMSASRRFVTVLGGLRLEGVP